MLCSRGRGKWGWTPLPASVKTAAHVLASRWVKLRREGAIQTGEDGSVIETNLAIDGDLAKMLRRYTLRGGVT